ncbi:hypothetical protein ACQZV8_02195 [Magnetococcales bacterium HHB-1]
MQLFVLDIEVRDAMMNLPGWRIPEERKKWREVYRMLTLYSDPVVVNDRWSIRDHPRMRFLVKGD